MAEINAKDFLFYDPVGQKAKQIFGIKYLYPLQRLVIANIMDCEKDNAIFSMPENKVLQKDCKRKSVENPVRQIVLFPTGAGKSLCFQLPALLLSGVTLIIYPLLALITDQYRRLCAAGIDSVVFRGGQTHDERVILFSKIKEGTKIILTNPEVLSDKNFLEKLKSCRISHIAVDEAHCVCEWGESFRPAYLELGRIISEINPAAATAFTATASPEVLKKISEILFKSKANIIKSASDRPNIHYSVKYFCAKTQAVLIFARLLEKPMIVFCGFRNKAENISRDLNLCYGEGTAKFYHAGLNRDEKIKIEEWFFNGKEVILCATCAYGMGVDKKDIRTVIHMDPPESPEAYIQEAGRSGRDGNRANAILLWNKEDENKFSSFDKNSRKSVMKYFANTNECRRKILMNSLGDKNIICSGCDLCIKRKGIKSLSEIIPGDSQILYEFIKRHRNFFTEQTLQEEALKYLNKIYRMYIGIDIYTCNAFKQILKQLIEEKRIRKYSVLFEERISIERC